MTRIIFLAHDPDPWFGSYFSWSANRRILNFLQNLAFRESSSKENIDSYWVFLEIWSFFTFFDFFVVLKIFHSTVRSFLSLDASFRTLWSVIRKNDPRITDHAWWSVIRDSDHFFQAWFEIRTRIIFLPMIRIRDSNHIFHDLAHSCWPWTFYLRTRRCKIRGEVKK